MPPPSPIPDSDLVYFEENDVTKKPFYKKWLFYLLSLILVSCAVSIWLIGSLTKAPANFPVGKKIVVESGLGISSIAKLAEAESLVHSRWLLYFLLVTKYKNTPPQASTYVFESALNLDSVAYTLSRGDHGNDLIPLTIIEGESNESIANKAEATLKQFNKTEFLDLAKSAEGQLFPETYYLPQSYTASDLFILLTTTFQEKTSTLADKIIKSKFTLTEIVILASIIEREANSEESMKLVSGILEARLELDMPLQVDATMEYVLDQPLSELTAADLKHPSPYNTYLNKGLPPTAIGNPGLASIKAVLEPTPSDYLFYVTGDDGEFYYAKNFEEHKLNIAKHLH